jgi:hypothetical protein
MHNEIIRKEYKIKVEKLQFPFYGYPQFIHIRNHYIIRQVRYTYNTVTGELILLDNIIGKEIVISYFTNLKEERKLKLEKINESR